MKKLFLFIIIFVLVFTLSSCQKEEKTLTIYFVPSKTSEIILTTTEPLKVLIKEELSELGYEFDEIILEVGITYSAVGEALNAGVADIGFLPADIYVIASDEGNMNVALTATRDGLSKDFDNAIDWNDGIATEGVTTNKMAYYRGLIISGTSSKAGVIAGLVNAGTKPTWEQLDDLKWCVQSTTNTVGYIYPSLWLMSNYDGKKITDLTNTLEIDGYGRSMENLATGVCDVGTFYADARRTYAKKWVDTDDGYAQSNTIWEETNVIGVTAPIINDTISVSTITVDADLMAAIQQAFINIAATTNGSSIFSTFGHEGYIIAEDSDYDTERSAQILLGNILDDN